MIVSAVVAFLTSLVFGWILPTILGLVLATLISGLTLLDPLYAASRVEAAWGLFKVMVAFQGLHTFLSAPIAGICIGYLQKRIKSNVLYVIGMVLTAILHYLFLFLFVIISSLLYREVPYSPVVWISVLLNSISAVFIGVAGVFSAKRWAK